MSLSVPSSVSLGPEEEGERKGEGFFQ
jgi:hypothetical protein